MTQILLAGNPNCGKTTLFNALTGENQRVGNWPGVTVEKKVGFFNVTAEKRIELIDLPGVYSLVCDKTSSSQDEQIAAQAIAYNDADLIINVVDACYLERHLYLTSQLLELKKPMIVVLNMTDLAKQRGIEVDVARFSQLLKCPVVPIQAHRGKGIDVLKQTLCQHRLPASPLALSLTPKIQTLLEWTETHILRQGPNKASLYQAYRLLEGDTLIHPNWEIASTADADILLADARYQAVHDLVAQVQCKSSDASEHFTAKLDRIVLHRFFALPIFFAVMYVMFLFAINVGGAFQDFFDITTDVLFVQSVEHFLQSVHTPSWIVALAAHGIGRGINTTLTFVPVIGAMFFFLSLLEVSGYMARAAFVVDKVMRQLGLPGKSFVPMIVGFGCNVPAIMAARTLDTERERLLTILMSPFMSCSARLAIYAVFVAAFFPTGGQNVVFSLYLIGILMAVLTGYLLRKRLLTGQASPLILELPTYHKPTLKRLGKETLQRLRLFVLRAGKLIIPVSILLGGLNALSLHGEINHPESPSILAWLGQALTPLFAPMGIHQDNWPATVGLLTGMLAKEVVVGSLNTLYTQTSHLSGHFSEAFDWLSQMKTAFLTIPQNLAHLGEALLNPILASAPNNEVSKSMFGAMYQRFDGQVGAYAYLLFILLYVPCVSTMAAIRQEANSKWMWFSITWSFVIAYVVAVVFYQAATFHAHPMQSLAWFLGLSGLLFLVGMVLLFNRSEPSGERHATANS